MCVYCQNIYLNKNNFSKLKGYETELMIKGTRDLSNPFISIIITVYKRKKYIHEAIRSAIHQKNIDFDYEIIVLCDDPKSNMSEFNIYKNMQNIFIYRNYHNLGLYNSTNLGVTIAKGNYVAFLHDDDILYPEYLSKINKFIQNNSQTTKCILVNRDVIGHPRKTEIFKHALKFTFFVIFLFFFFIRFLFRKTYNSITLKEGLTYTLSNIYKAPSCGTLFERESFVNAGGFDQDFWPVSDYYFFLKFNKDAPIYMLREKLACYRWIDNLSQSKSVQHAGFDHFSIFFKSTQPIASVNKYFSFFLNEILYTKFLMVDKQYRDEIINKYPELKKRSKIRWLIFKSYNKGFRFVHDLIV